MKKQVYRLRVPDITRLWFYEVAESPEKACRQVSDEFKDKYVLEAAIWEVEVCPMDDLARVLHDYRKVYRLLNYETDRKKELYENLVILKERFVKAGNEVMSIVARALAGYLDDYKLIRPDGSRFTQWGAVERDIRRLFEVEEPNPNPSLKGREPGGVVDK